MRRARPTTLDRAIAAVLPGYAARRLAARGTLAMLGGGYTGARTDRRQTKNWAPRTGDADADTIGDLTRLRVRSRDLIRNDPIAAGAINQQVSAVVGLGLRPSPAIDAALAGVDEATAEAFAADILRLWRSWAGAFWCDTTLVSPFAAIEAQALRSVLESGDVLAILRSTPRPGAPWRLNIELVEADRLDNPTAVADGGRSRAHGNRRIVEGVELDDDGAPVAYHVRRFHPGTARRANTETVRVPLIGAASGTRQAVHVYDRLRPGQTRGVPLLAPVMEPLRVLGEYSDAELMAAVVSAFFTVFVTSEDGAGLGNMAPTAETGTAEAGRDAATHKLGHGAIVDLAPGERVETANPGRPNAEFAPFEMAMVRRIGMALGVPYEVLVGHYQASYSASRAALLDAWRMWRQRRAWLAARFHTPVWRAFVTEAVASGRIAAPGFFDDALVRHAWCGVEWIGDAPPQIDPVKEVDAAVARIDGHLSTIERETVALTGGDWEANARQRQRERVAFAGAAPARTPARATDVAGDDPDETDDGEGRER